jgi:nucleoside-triphosphatase
LGISLNQAVNLYLHQIKLHNGIPFALSLGQSATALPADMAQEPKSKPATAKNCNIFLTGPRQIGKSTVLQKTLALLQKEMPLSLGGFLTYWAGEDERQLYLAPADPAHGQKAARLADDRQGRQTQYAEVFDTLGVKLLSDKSPTQLICMDELGFMEDKSQLFKGLVLACLDADTPVIGVLREGDIPWHAPIKNHPKVSVIEVNIDNREQLPTRLAAALRPYVKD